MSFFNLCESETFSVYPSLDDDVRGRIPIFDEMLMAKKLATYLDFFYYQVWITSLISFCSSLIQKSSVTKQPDTIRERRL